MWLYTPESTNHRLSKDRCQLDPMPFMPHYEHSSMVAILIKIRGIVRELSAGRNWLSFLLSALLFLLAKFSVLPTFDWPFLVTWFGKMVPPCTELPLCVIGVLPMMRVVFSGWLFMSTSSESTSIASVESSSLVLLGVENMTIWCISPGSDMVLLDQQYWFKFEKWG